MVQLQSQDRWPKKLLEVVVSDEPGGGDALVVDAQHCQEALDRGNEAIGDDDVSHLLGFGHHWNVRVRLLPTDLQEVLCDGRCHSVDAGSDLRFRAAHLGECSGVSLVRVQGAVRREAQPDVVCGTACAPAVEQVSEAPVLAQVAYIPQGPVVLAVLN